MDSNRQTQSLQESPIFVLKTDWRNMAFITIIVALLLAYTGYKGRLNFANLKALAFAGIVVFVWLALLAMMARCKIMIKHNAVQFTTLLRPPKEIELSHLQRVSLDTSGKTRTLNFYDDSKYSSEPLEHRADFFSKKDIAEFRQTLKQMKANLKIEPTE